MGEPTLSSPDDEPISIGLALAFERVRASMLGGPIGPVVVGRYELHERIGRGGMGAVHRAHDPELDRDVAVKLVPSTNHHTQQRMLREAEALARLSHPNVVQIFDVGTYDSRARQGGAGVFIVMELVQGGTLARWLREPRSYDAILAKLVAAGRGLAAAHEVGLIHRDFKPENVLIAGERVLVADFGLARAARHDSERSSDPAAGVTDRHAAVSLAGHLDDAITDAGTALGTPPYMAPEQHADARVDERSDQYSFCVALWEALYGELPFRAVGFDALLRAKLGGEPTPPAVARKVPRSVHRAIVRGLAPDPSARWPSLAELITELSHRTAAGRRWPVRAVAALALVGLGAWGWQHARQLQTQRACAVEGERIAETWNAARADEIGTAFDALELSFTADVWSRARVGLDAHAAKWTATRTEVCERAELQHSLAPQLAVASRACLDEQLDEVNALIEQLARPDASMVQRTGLAISSLPQSDSCTDEDALRSRAESPTDPRMREQVAALRKRLSEIAAARALGREAESLPDAQVVLEAATALPWPPLALEANFVVGDILWSLGRYEEARVELERTFLGGVEAGRDDVAMRAATGLVQVVGVELARSDDGIEWSRRALALEQRLGLREDDLRSAHLATTTGNAHFIHGDQARALELYERGLAIHEQALGPEHPGTAMSLTNIGGVYYARGDYARAIEVFERALAIWETALGPDHPDVAIPLGNLGVVYHDFGEHRRAVELQERAFAIREEALDPWHPDLALALGNLGNVYTSVGEHARALELFERALAIREKVFAADHPYVADALHNVIHAYYLLGEHRRALELIPRALEIRKKALGPEHSEVGALLRTRGTVHYANGEPARAIEDYERSIAIQSKALGADHPDVALTREALATVKADPHRTRR